MNKGFLFLLHFMLIFLKLIILSYYLTDHLQVNMLLRELPYILFGLSLLTIVFKKNKITFLFIYQLLISTLFFSLVVYVKYFGTLPTYYDLFQLNQVASIKDTIFQLLSPKYFIFFVLDLVTLFLHLALFKRSLMINEHSTFTKRLLLGALIIIVIQCYSARDVLIIDPLQTAINKGFFTYETVQFYQDIRENLISQYGEEVTNEAIMELKGIRKIEPSEREYFGIAKDKNVLVVQLESFQTFLIGKEINGQEITPNLNELIKESFYFPNVYQQIGKGNTSDAEWLSNTSLYPAGDKPSSKLYENKVIPSLPRLLNDKNYVTSTFHADKIEYWNRMKLYPALGFLEYYALDYFGDEDIVGLGPSDEILYKKTMDKLTEYKQNNQKFYAQVISLTSHTPFVMPESKRFIDLPTHYKGTHAGNFLVSSNYSDVALGGFIDDLKTTGLWDDTLFVVYGDHFGFRPDLTNTKEMNLYRELTGRRYNIVDKFNIPLVIRTPYGKNNEEIQNLGGQIDIMPTITNLLGISLEQQVHFGQDLLNYDKNLLGMRYYQPLGSFFYNDIFLINDTDKNSRKVYSLVDKKIILDDSQYLSDEGIYNDSYNNTLELLTLSDRYTRRLPENE